MKNLLFGLIATVLFSNFSFGQRFNSTDFKTIGVEHNRMLEVTYVTILKNKVTNDKKDIVVSALIEDFRKNNYSGKDLELGINTLTHVFDNLPKKGIKMNFQENLYSDELGKSLDGTVKLYLNELSNIIDNNTTVIDLNSSLDKFENKIQKDLELKNQQLFILYNATSVARSSNKYWSENSKKWLELNNNGVNYTSSTAKHIVKADVAGAVGGAATALIANVVPGVGQVAFGGAVLTGAVGGSVFQATYEFLEWCGW